MKKYIYKKVISYNKTILVIEIEFKNGEYSSVSVFPVVRLTHYRYILNYRLDELSDYLDNEIRNGYDINKIRNLIAVGNLNISDSYTKYKYVNYNDTYIVISENKYMYSIGRKDGHIFKVIGLEDKNPNKCKYIEQHDNIQINIPTPNKMSIKRLNESTSSRFHLLLHLLETKQNRMD